MNKSLLFPALIACGLQLFSNFHPSLAQMNQPVTDENRYGAIARDYLQNPGKYNGQNSIQGLGEGTWDLKFSEPNITGDNMNDFGFSVARVGDVNGDFYDDVLVGGIQYNNNTGRAYLFYGGPEISSVADVVMTGEATWSQFGSVVAGCGDVNDDGYNDILIGASGYDNQKGSVYIYYGGKDMDATADLILTGNDWGDYFGASAAIAGDLNRDGYDDVIVGAYGKNNYAGRVYIYYGGRNMDNEADLILNGKADGNKFGSMVTGVNDVNNDGFADILICTNENNFHQVYLYYGGENMDNIEDKIFYNNIWNCFLGYRIAGAGDVNCDGYADLLISENNTDDGSDRVFLYFGATAIDDTADVVFTCESKWSLFSSSISTAGDVNQDGYDDILIGAQEYDQQNGRVYIYYGGPEIDDSVDVIINAGTVDKNFGRSLACVGDMNGDGKTDIVIGSNEHYEYNHGRSYLYLGGKELDSANRIPLNGEPEDNFFGSSIAGIGDVNNDGYMDILAGAPGYNYKTGQAYLYFGGQQMNTQFDLNMTGENNSDEFGNNVAIIGDVNNDGFADMLVSAPGYKNNTGRVYLYYGGVSVDSVADLVFTGEAPDIYFGTSVASAGDVNHDGFDDILIGASMYQYNLGRVYLYFGGSNMDNVPDVIMTGELNTEWINLFGHCVAGAGDVNGDGFDDVLVGAKYWNNNNGKVYLYYGGADMDNIADMTFIGKSVWNCFGNSVAGIGDVNNDGYDDFFVGEYTRDNESARAYLYFGGKTIDNKADITLIGENNNNSYFGWSAAGVGDINKDGYNDILFGLHYTNSTSQVYVLFGGSTMDAIADVTLTGESAGDQFGCSVAGIGDINMDGYSDFVVGSSHYGENKNGAVYLYYGDKTLDIDDSGTNQLSRPVRVQLQNNYPNPFNPTTTITFELPERANVEIAVFDITGRKVRTLLHEWRGSGGHNISWDGRDDAGIPVSSGVFLCKLSTDKGYTETKKMTLMK